jgi:hypothetical protein
MAMETVDAEDGRADTVEAGRATNKRRAPGGLRGPAAVWAGCWDRDGENQQCDPGATRESWKADEWR